MYMEISQGNFQCSYLYLKQAKMSWFFFFIFSVFSSIKSENRMLNRFCLGGLRGGVNGISGRGEVEEKGIGG
jgi:hypothetical protein